MSLVLQLHANQLSQHRGRASHALSQELLPLPASGRPEVPLNPAKLCLHRDAHSSAFIITALSRLCQQLRLWEGTGGSQELLPAQEAQLLQTGGGVRGALLSLKSLRSISMPLFQQNRTSHGNR